MYRKYKARFSQLHLMYNVRVCVCVLTTGSEGLPYYAVPTARLIQPPQRLQCHISAGLLTPASPWLDVS
jgi:hypothetical protein